MVGHYLERAVTDSNDVEARACSHGDIEAMYQGALAYW